MSFIMEVQLINFGQVLGFFRSGDGWRSNGAGFASFVITTLSRAYTQRSFKTFSRLRNNFFCNILQKRCLQPLIIALNITTFGMFPVSHN